MALTHDNLAWTAETLGAVVDLDGDDVHLSYLSMAHIAEQLASIYLWLDAAYTVHYCHDGLQVAEYLKEVEPTFFFGVPRVWERFRSAIMAQFNEATGARAALLSWTRGVGTRVTDLRNQGQEPRGVLALQHRLADRLVFRKLRATTGLGRTRAFITGAAGTPPHILEFFGSLGICLLELYGQSEGTGPTSTNRPGATRFGTVGRPLDGISSRSSRWIPTWPRGSPPTRASTPRLCTSTLPCARGWRPTSPSTSTRGWPGSSRSATSSFCRAYADGQRL